MKQTSVPVEVVTITAGKFRRYMDMALWKQVLHPDIGGRNLVDMFKIAGGVAQSLGIVRKFRPDVVFAKGGYVSLPVGYAAYAMRVPLVVHDSDARPGLTSRVLSRWAAAIATGLPSKAYRFGVEKTVYAGVPVYNKFHAYSSDEQRAAKASLGLDPERTLIAVTAGGLGSRSINTAVATVADQLVRDGFSVYHVTGKKLYDEVSALPLPKKHYVLAAFYDNFADVYGAADVVVARAGATTLLELAAASRPAVIVPASKLGDQPENAAVYEKAGAAVVLTDEQIAETPELLAGTIKEICNNQTTREQLTENITKLARPDAAKTVAELLVKHRKKSRGSKKGKRGRP